MIGTRWIVLLLISIGSLAAEPQFLPARVSLATNDGFCATGAYPTARWVEGKPRGLNTWGSYCAEGAQGIGTATTTPFAAPAHLRLYLSGFTSQPGIVLRIERLSDGAKLSIHPVEQAAVRWLPYDFEMPRSWIGMQARLLAEDRSSGEDGWFGFSEPLDAGGPRFALGEAFTLLWRTSLHFLLITIPAFAICAAFVYRGVRDFAIAGLVALAGTGLCGYAGFWLWFFSPPLGHLVAFITPIVSGVCLVFILRKLNRAQRNVLKKLLTPVLLTGAASMLILSTGFLYGGMRDPISMANTRFSHTLPGDNAVPYIVAEYLRVGAAPKLLFGDWHSSDRPPLETGMTLSQYPYNPNPTMSGYTAMAVIAQSLWIFALWILLSALDLDTRAIALVLIVCLFSGFVLVNSFFVWPKLLAGSYTLGCLALLLSNRLRKAVSDSRLVAALGGALLAFGMLSHGGSAFAILGIALTMVVLRKWISRGSLLAMAATAFALYLPWMLYQKLYDPPGNRLLTLHLAGMANVSAQPFLPALRTAYARLTAGEIAANKWRNFIAATDHQTEYWKTADDLLRSAWNHNADRLAGDAANLRKLNFFFFAPALGFLAAGLPALLFGIDKANRSPEWKSAAVMWVFVVLTIGIWCLLMFGPSRTLIHQGTYVTVLLGYAACVLSLWSISPRLAILIAGLQIAFTILLYVGLMAPVNEDGVLVPRGAVRYGTLALAILSLCLVLALAVSLRHGPGAGKESPESVAVSR